MDDKKLTPGEIAELRKKENSNVLRKYGMQKGDTTARTIKPTIPIRTGGSKLLQFPTGSTVAPDPTGVSGDPGEGTDVEAELNKP